MPTEFMIHEQTGEPDEGFWCAIFATLPLPAFFVDEAVHILENVGETLRRSQKQFEWIIC
jgi:hypothetical protein